MESFGQAMKKLPKNNNQLLKIFIELAKISWKMKFHRFLCHRADVFMTHFISQWLYGYMTCTFATPAMYTRFWLYVNYALVEPVFVVICLNFENLVNILQCQFLLIKVGFIVTGNVFLREELIIHGLLKHYDPIFNNWGVVKRQ